MSAGASSVPVALFVFNRPALTERVFRAIAGVRPSRLLVVADGPRADHPEDAELVSLTRAVVEQVDWPCRVERCYSEVNLGCRRRLSSGLDWVFAQVEEAIILEDDCLPDPSFFPYCAELLARYRHDHRVQMVSGVNVLDPRRVTEYSYYFSRCYHVWGWASWSRAWAHYDVEMRRWPEVRRTSWLRDLLGNEVQEGIAREIFDLTHAGRVGTWDFQWVFAGWLAGGLSIIPSVNLVSNLGYGPQATHERHANHPVANLARRAMSFPLRHPGEVKVLQAADDAEWELMYPDHHRLRQRGRLRRASRARSGGDRSTLVMGAAVGQPVDYVAPYLISLRRAGYAGSVVLFVDRSLRRALRANPLAAGVTLVAVPQWPPFRFGLLERPRLMRRAWDPSQRLLYEAMRAAGRLPGRRGRPVRLRHRLAQLVYSPMETRFLHYQRFLAAHPHERVLLTDVRDVVFQSDPFEHLPRAGLATGLEVDSYSLATEPHNAAWIERVYGAGALHEIGANRVANVGVTYGDRTAIARYLELMVQEILRIPPEAAAIGGTDTAIHNRLLWTGQLGEVQLLEPLSSPVATLNGVPAEEVHLNDAGRLSNRTGGEPSVVHQYDRVPAIHRRLLSAVGS